MSVGSIGEFLEERRWRYMTADKAEKSRILNEVCTTLHYHRKAAIRALRRPVDQRPPRPGRPLVYGPFVDSALREVWELADQACSKRLAPYLDEFVGRLESCGELQLDPDVRAQLVRLSPATIDRHLGSHRRSLARPPYRAKTSPNSIRAQVPIRTFGEWEGVQPGSVQADLVLHCGQSAAGFFLTTLVVTDIATGWTECEAIYGMGKERIGAGIHRIRSRLPMQLRELHTDNGTEFLNSIVYPYCKREGIRMTRGRPYKKNDQAYVEERNGMVVRRLVGYDRYGTDQAKKLLNEFYMQLRLYLNFFQPTRKLIAKQRHGAKVRKVFDQAATPYRRLLASGALSDAECQRLHRTYSALNPVKIKRGMTETMYALRQHRESIKTAHITMARLEMGARLMDQVRVR